MIRSRNSSARAAPRRWKGRPGDGKSFESNLEALSSSILEASVACPFAFVIQNARATWREGRGEEGAKRFIVLAIALIRLALHARRR